jgi:hypothetical protein
MAKKSKFELDNYGFSMDTELDMPNFNFSSPKVKDDRKPTTKIAKAYVGGFKETVKSPSFIRKFILTSLPKGYGDASALADETATTLKNLYNTSAQEIKPVLKDLKRTTNRILPVAESALPKKVAERIKKWAKDNDELAQDLSPEAQRDYALQMQLAEIFKFQTEASLKKGVYDDTQNTIRDAISQNRHRDQISQLDAIRIGIQQLTGYQSKITANYQRKSLELQFRHYFVAMDMLTEQKRQNAISTTHLENIVKNTGLPEFVKLKNTERVQEVIRNKFAASISGGIANIFSRQTDYVKKVGDKLIQQAKDKLAAITDAARVGLSGIDMALDAKEMMEAMGDNRTLGEHAAGFAGSMSAEYLANKAGKKVRGLVKKHLPGVERFGTKLQERAGNAGAYLTDFAESSKGERGTGGIWDNLVWGLKNAIMSANAVDTGLTTDKAGSMQEPAMFSRGASKSITEIIPGYLSRIYRELQIIRTGNDRIQLTTYDYSSNKFADKSTATKNILKSLVNKEDVEWTKKQVDSVINEVDKNKKLTPEQRQLLANQLLVDRFKNRSAGASRLSSPASYRGEAGKHAGTYSELFKDYFANDKSHEKQLYLSEQYRNIGNSVRDPRAIVQDFVNLGQREYLEDLGILKPGSDEIDVEKFLTTYYGNGEPPAAKAEATTGHRLGKRRPAAMHPVTPRRRVVPINPARGPAKGPTTGPTIGPEDHAASAPPEPFAKNETRIENYKELIDAIKENSSKSVSEIMSETLLRIEKRLTDGINITGIGRGKPGAGGKTADKDWWNKSLKDIGGGLVDFGTDLFGRARKFGSKVFSQGLGLAKSGISLGKSFAKTAFEHIKGFNDVYVKGEALPRLLAWKLKAGHYRDQVTGKVIKTFKDIQGAVIDENGNIVLSADEIKKAFVKSGVAEKFITALGSVADKAKSIGAMLLGRLPGVYQAVSALVQKTWGLLSLPQDVYVKGKLDPVLLARIMRTGGYFSRRTGKVIHHPGEIDGAVVDEDGNIVLTIEELAQGLYDKNGKIIHTGLSKLLNIGKDYAKRGLAIAKYVAGKAKEVGLKAWGAAKTVAGKVGDFVTGGLSGMGLGGYATKDGIKMSGMQQVIKLLTEIRDRLPKPKRHLVGDIDNTGIRKGSYEDLLRRKKESDSEKKGKGEKEEKGGKGILGSIGAGISALLGRGKGKEKEGEGEKESGSGIGEAAETTAGTVAGNWLTKRLGGLKGALKFGGKALGLAGAAYGAYSAYDNLKQGNYGSAALDAGLSAGTTALSLGGLGGLGALATGAGGVLTGIAAFLASPVVLGGLAIAAAGAAAYYGYKYLTRKKLDSSLAKMRYAQYGFIPTDTDHLQMVFGLEDKLEPAVYYEKGVAKLDDKKIEVKKIMDDFKVDLSDQNKLERWMRWFNERFKPVFLTHMTALKAANPKGDLGNLDKLTVEEKRKYLTAARFPDGPYNIMVSPFADMKTLTATGKEVNVLADIAEADLKKEEVQGKAGAKPGALAGATAAVVAADAAGSTAATTPGTEQRIKPSLLTDIKKQEGTASGLSASTISLNSNYVSVSGFDASKLDALTAIRFKAYGLKEIVFDKAKALNSLEDVISKDTTVTEGKANWNGDIEKILIKMGPVFGVEYVRNNDADNWVAWLTSRFIPVYLNYVSALCKATGKKDAASSLLVLKPNQAIDVAQAIYTTNGKYAGSSTSIWNIPASPWPGYEVNNDVKSTDANVQALKDQATKVVLPEEKSTVTSPPGGVPRPTLGVRATTPVTEGGGTRLAYGKIGGPPFRAPPPGSMTGIDAMAGAEPPPMVGTGGKLDQIPMPQGDGTWGALKGTILAAAKAAGVDGKLMATMAAIESGFKSTVKAGTSSATGLYQFISDTWNTMLRKHGSKYDIPPGTSPTDPRANALMGAEYLKENSDAIKGSVDRPLTPTDLYLAHFLGAGGAKKLLSADPSANAVELMPGAAKANPSIFYNPGATKDTYGSPRTVGEVYAEVNRRVLSRGKQFGIEVETTELASTSGTPGTRMATTVAAVPATATRAPEATTTAAASVPPTGSVFGQPPAPVAVATPMPVEKVSFTAPSAEPGAAALASGFSPQDRRTQLQYRRDETNASLGSISNVLESSLDVQKDQLEVLKGILKATGLMASRGAGVSGKPEVIQTKETDTKNTSDFGSPEPILRAPVSMAKPTWSS